MRTNIPFSKRQAIAVVPGEDDRVHREQALEQTGVTTQEAWLGFGHGRGFWIVPLLSLARCKFLGPF
jgi:hypothetical protein